MCIHTYACTCADFQVQHTICKHVHLVARYVNTDQVKPHEFSQQMTQSNAALHATMLSEISTNTNYQLEPMKSKILSLLKVIETQVQNSTYVQ